MSKHNSFKKQLLNNLLEQSDVCGICGQSLLKEKYELEEYRKILKLGSGGYKDFKRIRRKHINLNIDHKVPKSKGGTWDIENVHLTHKTCNTIKGDKLL